MLRGVRPFLLDKYDLTKHPNYKYTADADKKYLFDMERYCMIDSTHLCPWRRPSRKSKPATTS